MLAEINGKIVDTDFETIYKHSKGIMLTTIKKYVKLKPGDDYNDIIQLMAIDLFNAFSKGFDPSISSFKSYVITICRRRAFLYNRKNNQTKFEEDLQPLEETKVKKDKTFCNLLNSLDIGAVEEMSRIFGKKLTELDYAHLKDIASGKTREEMCKSKVLSKRVVKAVSRQGVYNRHHRVIDKIKEEIKLDSKKLEELKDILKSDENY